MDNITKIIPVVEGKVPRGDLTATVRVLSDEFGQGPPNYESRRLLEVVISRNGCREATETLDIQHFVTSKNVKPIELLLGKQLELKLSDNSTVKPASVRLTKQQRALVQYEPRCRGYVHRMWRK